MRRAGQLRPRRAPVVLLGVFACAFAAHANPIMVTSLADPGNPDDELLTLREVLQSVAVVGQRSTTSETVITFAPELSGGTIALVAPLPAIAAGQIVIDGDLDDDAVPDIGIDASGSGSTSVLKLISPGNTIVGLAFGNCRGVAVEIEGPQSTGNVIRCCHVGGSADVAGLADNGVGVRLAVGAALNEIGPDNTFRGNGVAIELDEGIQNRIVGNVIVGLASPSPQADDEEERIGVLLRNGSCLNTIGDAGGGLGNSIGGELTYAVLIGRDGAPCDGNVVRNNEIAILPGDPVAPGQVGETTGQPDTRGQTSIPVSLDGPATGPGAGLTGCALRIDNAATGNVIGPDNRLAGAVVDAVRVLGSGTAGNVIHENVIGSPGVSSVPNPQRDGIHIAEGASGNIVGPGNVIVGNGRHGVTVRGKESIHNRITRNAIYGNAGAGIALLDGANDGIAAPRITEASLFLLRGVANVPDGSLIELFADNEDEGRTYLGDAVVTAGEFSFSGVLPVEGNISATATDPDGATSRFATLLRGLAEIVIDGPRCVPSETNSNYVCTAYYWDAPPEIVTESATWSVSPDELAAITGSGELSTAAVIGAELISIEAEFSLGDASVEARLDVLVIGDEFEDCNSNGLPDVCELSVASEAELFSLGVDVPEDVVGSKGDYPEGYFVPDAALNQLYHIPLAGGLPTVFSTELSSPIGAAFVPGEFGGAGYRLFVAGNQADSRPGWDVVVVAPDGTTTPFADLPGLGAVGLTYVPEAMGGPSAGCLLVTGRPNASEYALYRVSESGSAQQVTGRVGSGTLFTPAIAPSAFGSLANYVFVGNSVGNEIYAIDPNTYEWFTFARLPLEPAQSGLRQISFSPAGWAAGIDAALDMQSVMLVSIAGANLGGPGPGAVAVLDQYGRRIAVLKGGPNGTEINPRGIAFAEDEILISDSATEHGWLIRATPSDFGLNDCDQDGVPDPCQIAAGALDCNHNGIPDTCDLQDGVSVDTDFNGVPDECQYVPGDVNCDGAVNNLDIDPFVAALRGAGIYATSYPDCSHLLADINDDGKVDNFDIDPFILLITGD